jgi:hypothetical protein
MTVYIVVDDHCGDCGSVREVFSDGDAAAEWAADPANNSRSGCELYVLPKAVR